jgi:two-component system chemotaxis sensor kinase CheA
MSIRPQDEFLEEARDLLRGMEEALLEIENRPDDPDLINAIFRAAHTIKGTGGVFSFDEVEEFTHVAENVLDKVRNGDLRIDEILTALLLTCRDHIEQLVEYAVNEEEIDEETVMRGKALMSHLKVYLGEYGGSRREMSKVEDSLEVVNTGRLVETDNWHISLRFDQEVLQNGMDPLSFLRYLKKIGEIISVTTLHDDIPSFSELDPELCYIGLEIDLKTDADKEQIEQVFEFVREMAQIHILPPKANIASYAEMIEALNDDEMRLGELLVSSGAITARELEDMLNYQQSAQEDIAADKPKLGDVLVDNNIIQKEVVDVALNKQSKSKEVRAGRAALRVDADKLDKLINLVGELVISGATTNLQAQRLGDERLLESISVMSRLVEEIRDNALTLRMVQIGETFNRFQRVVRDVSKELGKDIRLEISGADTELDKTVVEKIGDPLMHLVRNAMDHGIESAQDRQASGKSVQGALRLNAFHDSGNIVIEVSDDGRGLSKEKILAKAIEKGLVESGQNLSDREIYRLIFEPGFSTADQVTNLSGRGVGMDVVRKNIEALRGSVDIDSKPGLGANVSIRLPLTLAIIDGFLVRVGDSSYVIPLDMVIECIELEAGERQQNDRGYINLRGEVLPYLSLRDVFTEHGGQLDRENIVVVQYGNQRAGFVVDELLGEFQTVIKPMGKILQGVKGISGTTILGTGEVAVILDVHNLVQRTANMQGRVSNQPVTGSTAENAVLH